ncbi:MAG: helix-turn-helix transcriptional regulator [Myxococcota bacterium]
MSGRRPHVRLWPPRFELDGGGALHLAVLDGLDGAAFHAVVGVDGEIVVRNANRRGRERLWEDREAVLARVRESLLAETDTGAYRVEELGRAGDERRHVLLAERQPDATGRLGPRLRAAAEAWSLTRRQRELLALLAEGRSNTSIADTLGCAEKTVEHHITNLLKRSGARSREGLVAWLWSRF